jgi:hypothetical protein
MLLLALARRHGPPVPWLSVWVDGELRTTCHVMHCVVFPRPPPAAGAVGLLVIFTMNMADHDIRVAAAALCAGSWEHGVRSRP